MQRGCGPSLRPKLVNLGARRAAHDWCSLASGDDGVAPRVVAGYDRIRYTAVRAFLHTHARTVSIDARGARAGVSRLHMGKQWAVEPYKTLCGRRANGRLVASAAANADVVGRRRSRRRAGSSRRIDALACGALDLPMQRA